MLSKCCFDGAEGTDERVLAVAARCVAACETREVTSVEEGHDAQRVTETMRVST